MRRGLQVHPGVIDSDLADAVAYYADIDPNLAVRLVAEYEAGLRRIAAHPTLLSEYRPGWRRVLLGHFPYVLGFVVDGETAQVVGLFHSRMNPTDLDRKVRERG